MMLETSVNTETIVPSQLHLLACTQLTSMAAVIYTEVVNKIIRLNNTSRTCNIVMLYTASTCKSL
jgi:hypothetical protein